jgi:uncharacterized membrane protein YoaK (UPF0700 family)
MTFLNKHEDIVLHFLAATIGGFAAMYGIFVRGLFAQAVSANLTEIIVHFFLPEKRSDAYLRLGAVLIFGLTLAVAHLINLSKTTHAQSIAAFAIFLLFIISALIPAGVPMFPATYPLFILTATLWGNFSGANGWNSATIFNTNNMRQIIYSFIDYVVTKDTSNKYRGLFYLGTLVSFYVSAVICLALSFRFREKTAFFGCVIPCVMVLILLRGKRIKAKRHEEATDLT